LPVDLFYFGGYVNLLPLLMTAITVVTAALFQDPILSEAQLKKQKMNLYLMAAAFFLLFYPFPAGMVLYWTMNNLLALIKELVRKIFGRGRLITSVGEVS
jgi:membrane protein insertase Oxa1/YidC/SpoIIIJ